MFYSTFKVCSIGVLKKKKPNQYHKLKSRGNLNVRVIASVWEVMQKLVFCFFLFEDTKKNRRTCKQMNHLLLLHATLQDPYQPSTVNS